MVLDKNNYNSASSAIAQSKGISKPSLSALEDAVKYIEKLETHPQTLTYKTNNGYYTIGDIKTGSELTGSNSLLGIGGDDKIWGNEGDDVITAGSGDDFLDGGTGTNTLKGGSGSDVYVILKGFYRNYDFSKCA